MTFAFSVALSGGIFLLLGSALLRRVHPHARTELPFTSIYCAQMALWFASYFVLPVNAALAAAIGLSIPLEALIWGAAIAVVAIAAKQSRDDEGSPRASRDRTGLLITVAGVAAIAKVALAYSSQSHLGALGLDTHQHIYWTQQILDANHLALVERGTEILALYPKAFHLLTALWSAAGIVGPTGPWLKLMPFLQAFLPCIVFAELLWLRSSTKRGERAGTPVLAVFFAAALLITAFALGRMSYPNYDLGGTARFASGAALMFPYLVWVAGISFERPALRRLAWLALPATSLLLLAMNAILLVQLVIFVVPLLLVSERLVTPREDPTTGAGEQLPQGAWLLAGLLPVAIAIVDPWIVAQWTAPLGTLGTKYLSMFGVLSPADAAAAGLLATDELVSDNTGAIRHTGAGGLLWLLFTSIVTGTYAWLVSGWHFPFIDGLSNESGRIIIRVAVVSCGILAVRWTLERRAAGREVDSDPKVIRLFGALAIGAAVGGLAQSVSFEFAKGLAIGRSYAFTLLRDYCEIAAQHVGIVAELLILLAAIAWAVHAAPARNEVASWLGDTFATLILAGVALCLPFALYGVGEVVPPEKSFWAPVNAQDLEDLREIESKIGEGERAMSPSNTWGIGAERWIIPQGATASVLPFTTKPFVFNSRLGASIYYNWKDLASFCRGSNEHRADFLSRNGVRWFLLKGEGSGERSAYRRVRMCKLGLKAMGVVYPPEFQAGELSLYRIDPESLR